MNGDTWMIILGLTGSIGMGKSTTAKLFAEAGVPVYDADATVHMIYQGEAVPAIEAAFPGTTAGGKVDRAKLSSQAPTIRNS
jgi:dephospho-CoA kinase